MIRPESAAEHSAVARIHALAFDEQLDVSEVVLIDVHRRHPGFDPELSLVAEFDGRPVGHILLIPRLLRVGDVALRGTILSPLGVLPEFQGRGIGGALIREAHARAQRRGYQLVVLTGHPGYYPRFGYRTGMFSWSGIEIRREDLIPAGPPVIEERRVTPGDIPSLMDMWHLWFHDVDLAVLPGGSVLDWISPSREVRSCTAWIEDRLVGYVRYDSESVRGFLARDPETAVYLLSHLAERVSGGDRLEVPVHPESAACTGLSIAVESRLDARDPAMVCILDHGQGQLVQYCREVGEGRRSPGLLVWPVEYDVC